MNNNSLVSIIVPNYNHSAFLKERIESVLNQTYQDFELILLDDCSTDDSVSILKRYENHPKVAHCIFNEQNSGSPFKQWQKGMDLAKGDYIWIAESDDYCELDFLSTCMERIESDKSQIVYTQSNHIDIDGKVLRNGLNHTANFEVNIWRNDFSMDGLQFLDSYLLVKNVIPNASAVVFKKPKHGMIDWKSISTFKMCGDWLFWVQLSEEYSLSFIKEPLNLFRIHSASTRNHSSVLIKKRRVQEEVFIRNFIFKKLGIYNSERNLFLFKEWNTFFTFKELTSPDFKSGILKQLGYFKYLSYNMKRRVSKKFFK